MLRRKQASRPPALARRFSQCTCEESTPRPPRARVREHAKHRHSSGDKARRGADLRRDHEAARCWRAARTRRERSAASASSCASASASTEARSAGRSLLRRIASTQASRRARSRRCFSRKRARRLRDAARAAAISASRTLTWPPPRPRAGRRRCGSPAARRRAPAPPLPGSRPRHQVSTH